MAGGKTPVFLNKIAVQLREQNWFALAAELVIVVVGVFLGLQAANWNEERQERKDEEQILTRLMAETSALLSVVREERAQVQSRVDLLKQAQPVIFSNADVRPLTDDECIAVAGSHVYRREADQLPILEEMIGTGRFDRLRDEELKRLLRRYILFRDRQRGNHVERTNELFRLYSRHPEEIAISLVPRTSESEGSWGFSAIEGSRWVPLCDVAKMRTNPQFLNEAFDNMGRTAHVLLGYEEREAKLIELQERLGALLES